MAWTCHTTTGTCPTRSQTMNQHVLELLPVPMRPPMSSPCTRAPPSGRTRRKHVVPPAVEQLACTHAPTTTPADRSPPDSRPTASRTPTRSLAPQTRPSAIPAQHDAAPHAPLPPAAWPAARTPHSRRDSLLRYKSRPLGHSSPHQHHHSPPLPLRSHRRGARELHLAPLGHRAARPLWAVSGDATAAQLLPRPPSVTTEPP